MTSNQLRDEQLRNWNAPDGGLASHEWTAEGPSFQRCNKARCVAVRRVPVDGFSDRYQESACPTKCSGRTSQFTVCLCRPPCGVRKL